MTRGATVSRVWRMAALLLLAARPLAAQSAKAHIRVSLSYDAPSGCPLRPYFEGRVAERIQGAWLAEPEVPAPSMRVSVVPTNGQWVASLNYQELDGREVTRKVRAAACEEAVSAIALILSLALEDQSLTAEEEALLAPRSAGPPPAPSAAHSPRCLGKAPHGQSSCNAEASGTKDLASSRTAYELGASFLYSSGVGPHLAHGAELYFGISPDPRVSWLRLGFSVFDSGVDTTLLPHVRARVRSVATRIQSCPIRVRVTPWLSMPFCAGLELGLLNVEGMGESPYLTASRRDQSFWLVPSLSPRLALNRGVAYLEFGPEARLFPVHRGYQINYGGRLQTAFETAWAGLGVVVTAGLHFQ